MIQPLRFYPILKEKIWGSDRMSNLLNKGFAHNLHIGESWEIADHGDDTNRIMNQEFSAKTFHEILIDHREEIMGPRLAQRYPHTFPLLFKFIDGFLPLSLQVHPDDEYANKHENGSLGKTEFWYVVFADPQAYIVAGLTKEMTREEFKEAVENKTIEQYLNKIYVESGDVLYIPAGRLHAIMGGIVISEIQQNSDITYRVYDWDRKDKNGKARELHLEKALDVIDFKDVHVQKETPKQIDDETVLLTKNKNFTIEKLFIVQNKKLSTFDNDSFHILTVISGVGQLITKDTTLDISVGHSILIPHSVGEYKIHASYELTILKTYIE